MRELFSRMMTGAIIAGAALLVSACGGSETTNTADNTAMTEMNAMEPMEGSMNDMTAVDSAAMEANMAMDANVAAADNATNAM